ncbi:hypothetical protein DMUE_0664 [Dictyocoela muelleri]|nr:hypothetical protein DMUE_0664 [Dictyocoela muelleri]
MKNKSKKCYDEAFYYLNNLIKKQPRFIIIDFEMAAYLVNDIYKNSEITGCFFHISQILFRKIQSSGLTTYYKSSSQIRECLKMILALAFVPKNDLSNMIYKMDIYIKNNENKKKLKYYGKILNKHIAVIVHLMILITIKQMFFSTHFWSVVSRILMMFQKQQIVLKVDIVH